MSEKPKWTPGPWEIQIDLANRHVHQITALRGACSIARTSPWLASDSATESNANAHLIRAAPALYEELEQAVGELVYQADNWPCDCHHDDHHTCGLASIQRRIERGEKALALARGEAP